LRNDHTFVEMLKAAERLLASVADNVEHLKPVIAALRQACQWFSEGEIGWRIHSLLGICSQYRALSRAGSGAGRRRRRPRRPGRCAAASGGSVRADVQEA
jgi:hypothetical protein